MATPTDPDFVALLMIANNQQKTIEMLAEQVENLQETFKTLLETQREIIQKLNEDDLSADWWKHPRDHESDF